MDWRQSGAWSGLTPDWHLIDAPVIQLGSPMILDWHRIDIGLTSDWPWIVIGMAPDLLDWHRLAMIWHWICNELTPRWWGFAALWLLIYISLTIDMVLTQDWYQIGNGLTMDFVGLALDWCSIDFGLPLDYIEISAHQLPSDTGVATHKRWINIKLVTNYIGNRQSDGLSLDWCQRDICKKVKTFNITLGWMWNFWRKWIFDLLFGTEILICQIYA